jgi:hypothetical protein
MRLAEVAKAVTAGAVAFGTVWDASTAVGSVGGEAVTANEWVRIAVSTVLAAVAVWLIPNAAAPKDPLMTVTVRSSKTPQGYVADHQAE